MVVFGVCGLSFLRPLLVNGLGATGASKSSCPVRFRAKLPALVALKPPAENPLKTLWPVLLLASDAYEIRLFTPLLELVEFVLVVYVRSRAATSYADFRLRNDLLLPTLAGAYEVFLGGGAGGALFISSDPSL